MAEGGMSQGQNYLMRHTNSTWFSGKRSREKNGNAGMFSSRMLIAAKLSVLIGRFVCFAAELLSNIPTNLTRGRARG